MSDRLREALDYMDWIHDVAADWPDVDENYEVIAAAARRFLALTETGRRVEHYCIQHQGRVWAYPDVTECTFQRYQRANLGQPAETPCDIQRVVVIPVSDGESET